MYALVGHYDKEWTVCRIQYAFVSLRYHCHFVGEARLLKFQAREVPSPASLSH